MSYFFSILLIFTSFCAFAVPDLLQILTHDIESESILATFATSNSGSRQLAQIQLHFLAGPDCYSGWQNQYKTPLTTARFTLMPDEVFGVSASATYSVAHHILDTQQIAQVNSILLRLIGPENKFAQFIGTCHDQQINCCIPVVCSNDSGLCLPKNPLSLQPIVFNRALA